MPDAYYILFRTSSGDGEAVILANSPEEAEATLRDQLAIKVGLGGVKFAEVENLEDKGGGVLFWNPFRKKAKGRPLNDLALNFFKCIDEETV